MEFIMDMVHHNPGEPPFKTKSLDPNFLKQYGYNSQVFKHINTAVTFSDFDDTVFNNQPDALEWIEKLSENISSEISAAKSAGLMVFYHIDLFILPKAIKEKYHDEICDSKGRISLHKEKTLELHRAMFDEIFTRFPEVDGFIVRVGETYLHDTPFHTGDGAVRYGVPADEQKDFIFLLDFLRSEICVKHNKYLFFRTWDCFPDKFHANPEYYLNITNRIEPHQKLIFSIKHTALDFWRRVKFNECLTIGKHRQIIEVQCQREYEGKGAYPMYVMNGVINSFAENKIPKGLRDIAKDPLICGIYTWSRGGGWFGPYPKDEFWCKLNTYVISHFALNPEKTEEKIFIEFAKNEMLLSEADAQKFRHMCLIANTAVLKSRYIECYDRTLNESIMPCRNWMRDDRLGGMRQLKDVFEYLYAHDLIQDALTEKFEAVLLWRHVMELYKNIYIPDKHTADFIKTSIDYAIKLFTAVYYGWCVMAEGFCREKEKNRSKSLLLEAITNFDNSWENYMSLADNPFSSTLYKDEYLKEPGLRESIEHYRKFLNE